MSKNCQHACWHLANTTCCVVWHGSANRIWWHVGPTFLTFVLLALFGSVDIVLCRLTSWNDMSSSWSRTEFGNSSGGMTSLYPLWPGSLMNPVKRFINRSFSISSCLLTIVFCYRIILTQIKQKYYFQLLHWDICVALHQPETHQHWTTRNDLSLIFGFQLCRHELSDWTDHSTNSISLVWIYINSPCMNFMILSRNKNNQGNMTNGKLYLQYQILEDCTHWKQTIFGKSLHIINICLDKVLTQVIATNATSHHSQVDSVWPTQGVKAHHRNILHRMTDSIWLN